MIKDYIHDSKHVAHVIAMAQESLQDREIYTPHKLNIVNVGKSV